MRVEISADDKAIKDYYTKRKQIEKQGVTHEMGVRGAFQDLLESVGRKRSWTLIPEARVDGEKKTVRPDGTFFDDLRFPHGYWEAKDRDDDLDLEIEKKIARNYPLNNIIFEDTQRGVLYQSGNRVADYDLTKPEELSLLLTRFINFEEPMITDFEKAVDQFQQRAPELAEGLQKLITEAHKDNPKFKAAFADFWELCRTSINPNIRKEAIDEMLIQHLLTERLMRTVFDNEQFTSRNVIAQEVEKVIVALTYKNLNRKAFLGQLNYFYEAIENAARTITDFTDKQQFINTVYERFFQGYAVNVADTHGIVYTPQPIVDFMWSAVEEVMRDEFGQNLWDAGVNIIDPATGTGNFIVKLLQRVHDKNRAGLHDLYKNRLFANEVMLLPYYVAALNIEHTYYDLTGQYEPFEGIAFADTLDLAEGAQMQLAFMTEANSERVERQKQAEINVIIGNPPYNVGQINENDNNKNRAYNVVDEAIRNTYVKDSEATLKRQLYDAYVRFFRWATDRLGERNGVVCFVTNNNFVESITFDGMRKHLVQDFTRIYHIDLHGNVRQNPKISGTSHNVFGIQVGVGITIAVRNSQHKDHKLYYHRVPEMWRKEDKLGWLQKYVHDPLQNLPLQSIKPSTRHSWIKADNIEEYNSFVAIGNKDNKQQTRDIESIFRLHSPGILTSRDGVVYDFDKKTLSDRIQQFIKDYNIEVMRFESAGMPKDVDNFVNYQIIDWSSTLKVRLRQGAKVDHTETKIVLGMFRPFTAKHLYFDRILIDRPGLFPRIFPVTPKPVKNLVISVTNHSQIPFVVQMTDAVTSEGFGGRSGKCFPFYTYMYT